jgi:hypothetical protein
MMGASFQASIAALFFNQLLDILVSPKKLRTLQRFSTTDPFLRKSPAEDVKSAEIGFEHAHIGRVTALAIIIVNLAVILLALLFFVVCVRLAIHAGYYYKAAAHENKLIKVSDCLKLTLQTQVRKAGPLYGYAINNNNNNISCHPVRPSLAKFLPGCRRV